MVDIQNLFDMSSSSSQRVNNNLNIYINMGFEQSLAERAFVMYGDNIQEATTWLLRQSSLGQMPKRFKNTNKDFVHTFYKSKLRIEDDVFYVSDYDPKYNIIQISVFVTFCPLRSPCERIHATKHQEVQPSASDNISLGNPRATCARLHWGGGSST